MGLYLREHYDDETLRAMGVRGIPPAAPGAPGKRAPAPPRPARSRAARSGSVESFASAADAPPQFRGAAEQIRRKDWLQRSKSTDSGLRWLMEG